MVGWNIDAGAAAAASISIAPAIAEETSTGGNTATNGLGRPPSSRVVNRFFILPIRTVLMMDMVRAANPMHTPTIARTNDAIPSPP